MKIFTHSGRFHADDVFATAVIQLAFDAPCHYVRTRDPQIIQQATEMDLVIDVGNSYDPVHNRFDHHQYTAAELNRASGTEQLWPYAAFGLIWKHFGETAIQKVIPHLPKETAAALHAEVDNNFVRWLDADDVGIKAAAGNPTQIATVVAAFNNPNGNTDEDFCTVVAFAKQVLTVIIRTAAESVSNNRKLAHTIHNHPSTNPVLELSEGMDWVRLVRQENQQRSTKIQYIISPRRDGSWAAQSVPDKKDSYRPLYPFPHEWATLHGEALQQKSGIPDAEFCHGGRHLFIAKTRAGVFAAAARGLILNNQQPG